MSGPADILASFQGAIPSAMRRLATISVSNPFDFCHRNGFHQSLPGCGQSGNDCCANRSLGRRGPGLLPSSSEYIWHSPRGRLAECRAGLEAMSGASPLSAMANEEARAATKPKADIAAIGPQTYSCVQKKGPAEAGPFIYWSRKLRILRLRDGCFSLRSAFASIWRMRSRVTLNCWPTSSSV